MSSSTKRQRTNNGNARPSAYSTNKKRKHPNNHSPDRPGFFTPPLRPNRPKSQAADYHFFVNAVFAEQFIRKQKRKTPPVRPINVYVVQSPFDLFKQNYNTENKRLGKGVRSSKESASQVSFIDQDLQRMERLIDALLLVSALGQVKSFAVMSHSVAPNPRF